MSNLALIAIAVGNTRTHIGLFLDDELENITHLHNDDRAGAVECVTRHWKSAEAASRQVLAMASVNDSAAKQLSSVIEDQLGEEVFKVGEDLPVPIGLSLDPESTTGVDRLLNAAAAWELLKQACIVVDAGTAVTVDFVDGEGVFHGGAIAPGLTMQLDALANSTDALPEMPFALPEGKPFGSNTAAAMQRGVFFGVRGLVWKLVEEYAAAYGAFPLVVATGGDAEVLFKNDEIVNRVIPELELRGIALAARHALSEPEHIDAEE
jgi:type III pantothenate kinase